MWARPVRVVGVWLCDDRRAPTRLITAVGARSAWYLRELAPPGPRGTFPASIAATRALPLVRCAHVHAPLRHPRAADGPAAIGDLYAAAVEMSVWAESRRGVGGRVGAPRVARRLPPVAAAAAAAIASRTSTVPIMVAALLVPLHDPVRLAEDMAVLDVISPGVWPMWRVWVTAPRNTRCPVARSAPAVGAWTNVSPCCRRWSGDVFEYDGRVVPGTPPPTTPGGPLLFYGGGSRAAARRPRRASGSASSRRPGRGPRGGYRDECTRLGEERYVLLAGAWGATSIFVADDVDRAWEKIGPFMLHDRACTRRGCKTPPR